MRMTALTSKSFNTSGVYSMIILRMKKHATKMVFVVIITFGLCWFPQNMRFFLRGLNYPNMIFWEENVNSPELLLLVQSTIQVKQLIHF